jgi:hypothetical protein
MERLGSVLTAKILMTERSKLLFTPKLPLLMLALTLSRALPVKLAGIVASILSVMGSATGDATVVVSAFSVVLMLCG